MTCAIPAAAVLAFAGASSEPSTENLARSARHILCELKNAGFDVPTPESPVRVFSLSEPSQIAGGWRPGHVSVRSHLREGLSFEVYLRHELMHEASFRTCKGRLPQWVEEAFAMTFSGEAAAAPEGEKGNAEELEAAISRGRMLTSGARRALASWLRSNPLELVPCQLPAASPSRGITPIAEPAFRVIHIFSGRKLAAHGNQTERTPPGSLLKVPYAACIGTRVERESLGRWLARSDTSALLAVEKKVDRKCLADLLGLKGSTPGSFDARDLLGFRSKDGNFPIEMSLEELARSLRAAFLSLGELPALGRFDSESTLAGASPEARLALTQLDALTKTGTVADARGLPLFGHLALVWPKKDPRFLAVVRLPGVNGATAASRVSQLVASWKKLPSHWAGVARVRIGSRLPEQALSVESSCAEFRVFSGLRGNVCGKFRARTTATRARKERDLPGLLETRSGGLVLHTDPETYADGVLAAEAAHLTGEARKALRAVVVWNAIRADEKQSTLCDTTRCMVFQGAPSTGAETTPSDLLETLEGLSADRWLSFSLGGREPWNRSFSAPELASKLREPSVIDIRIEGTRVAIDSADSTESVPCETFRNRLRLLSCPKSVRYESRSQTWIFRGEGEGHGKGLSLVAAEEQARQGRSAKAILSFAYSQR